MCELFSTITSINLWLIWTICILHVLVFFLRAFDLIWMQIKILTIVKDRAAPLFIYFLLSLLKVYKKFIKNSFNSILSKFTTINKCVKQSGLNIMIFVNLYFQYLINIKISCLMLLSIQTVIKYNKHFIMWINPTSNSTKISFQRI